MIEKRAMAIWFCISLQHDFPSLEFKFRSTYQKLKAAAAAKSLQSCPTLCNPIDGSPPGSPVPGVLQARTLEWVAISFLQCIKEKSESEVAQSCLTLSDPMDCSLTGSSIHGIFQAKVQEFSHHTIWNSNPAPCQMCFICLSF